MVCVSQTISIDCLHAASGYLVFLGTEVVMYITQHIYAIYMIYAIYRYHICVCVYIYYINLPTSEILRLIPPAPQP